MRSINTKMVVAFLLLILLSMQFIGAYLLNSLEDYFLEESLQQMVDEALVLAVQAAPFLEAGLEGMTPPDEPGLTDGAGGAGFGSDGDEAVGGPPRGSPAGGAGIIEEGSDGAADFPFGPEPGEADSGEVPPGLAGLRELVNNLAWESGSLAIIADGTGRILASSDPGLEGQRIVRDFIAEVLEGASIVRSSRLVPESGDQRVYAAAPIRTGGRIVGSSYVESDVTWVYETLIQIRSRLFTATAVALAVTAFLVLLVGRTITGPIQAITRRAARMAGGDFDQTIEVKSKDEVGQLAEMFNVLAGRLRNTLAEMADEKSRVEAIVTNMADGVVAVDRDGSILLINPAAREMLGIAGDSRDPVGQDARLIWDDAGIRRGLERALAGGGPGGPGSGDGPGTGGGSEGPGWVKDASAAGAGASHIEAPTLRQDRSGRVLKSSFAPIGGGEGGAAGAVWVLHDVTEFQRLDQMRKEFVANVSHELRTPLTTIKSYVETLIEEKGMDKDVQHQFLNVVNAEADRMVRMVKDLLDLSHMDIGSHPFDREYILLTELAAQAEQKLQPQAEEKGLTLVTVYPPEEPLLYADPDRIQQVMLNLLSNAIEFTPPGGTVTLSVAVAEGKALVAVEDTGVGIPAEDLRRIFDRFYRVDKARSRTLGGTGLGLAIAHDIIEGHGGSIHIQSEPDRGTKVWFVLPIDDTPIDTPVDDAPMEDGIENRPFHDAPTGDGPAEDAPADGGPGVV